MRSKITLLGLVTAATLMLAGPASANLAELLGNWHNVNPSTRGIVRVEIIYTGGAVEVHAWGACTPNPCDWGVVKATPYAPNVSAPLPQDALYLEAEYKTSFSVVTLVIGPAPGTGGTLRTIALTRFTDNSGRSAYEDTEWFKK